MPPGLRILGERRALCPRDRRHGGSWAGVNDLGLVAAITNAPGYIDPEALSRGHVVFEALSCNTPLEAVKGIEELLSERPSRPFQLLLSDADDCRYLRYVDGCLESRVEKGPVVSMSNLIGPERCELCGAMGLYDEVAGTNHDIESLLDRLGVTMASGRGRDRESGAEFPVCLHEGQRPTVSSTLIAVPHLQGMDSLRQLRFRYAAGNPLEVDFKEYDDLSCGLIA